MILKNKRGFVMVWVAGSLPVLLLFVALALDMGRLQVTASRLQMALDAASHAAVNPDAGEIIVYPTPVPVGVAPRFVVTLNQSAALTRARGIFDANVPLHGARLDRFNVRIVGPGSVEVEGALLVQTYIIGPIFSMLRVATDFREIRISRRAVASTEVR